MTMALQNYPAGLDQCSSAALRRLAGKILHVREASPEEEQIQFRIDAFGFDQAKIDPLLAEKCDFTAEIAALTDDPDSPHAATRHLLRALQNHCCAEFMAYLACFDICEEERTERLVDFAKSVFGDCPVGRVLQPTREDRLKAAQVLGACWDLGLTEISRLLGLSRGAVYRAIRRARCDSLPETVAG